MKADLYDITSAIAITILVVVFVSLIYIAIYVGLKDIDRWNKYKEDHNCEIVGREQGSFSTVIVPIVGGSSGMGIIVSSEPEKVAWKCDDGVTYWRLR